jgi:cysteine desulfurase
VAYLDYAATAPPRPEAVAAMLPLLTERFGNPSGGHSVARMARQALEDARDAVAAALGCQAGEVVFTSGGTEADNLAVLGAAGTEGPGAVVCSAIEHPAVLEPCRRLGARLVGVGPDGRLDLEDLAAALDPEVRLVSVMAANNEVGTIQPLEEVSALVRRRAPRALLHSDAVHAAASIDLSGLAPLVDLLSLSAHKVGGPKGTGALMVRAGAPLAPPFGGGPQERGRRPGTQNVAGAVGMAAALTATQRRLPDEVARVRALRDELASRVMAGVPGAVDTGSIAAGPSDTGARRGRVGKTAGIFHVLVPGVDNEELLVLLDDLGVCASAGSACASGAVEPSHVLLAMGLSPRQAGTAIRFSLGPASTEQDVEDAVAAVTKAVQQLRA